MRWIQKVPGELLACNDGAVRIRNRHVTRLNLLHLAPAFHHQRRAIERSDITHRVAVARMRMRRITLFAIGLFAGASGGCSPRDISHEPPFANMIGHEYRVIGDVDAYGIKQDLQDKDASYVTLIPPPGIGGPEVVFKRRVPKGQTFRIRGAMRRSVLLDNGTEYVIDLQRSDLPQDIEVRLALMRGNESGEADLNPRLCQRLVK